MNNIVMSEQSKIEGFEKSLVIIIKIALVLGGVFFVLEQLFPPSPRILS